MDLDELDDRLVPFVRHHTGNPFAKAVHLKPAPGHAGFSYFFDAVSEGHTTPLVLRLPPPHVKLEGTADVLRQVEVLRALDATDVPHASVVWSGDDPQWFGTPYFVVDRFDGDVARGDFLTAMSQPQRDHMAAQAMTALAGVHRLEQQHCPYLGDFWGFEFDVTRWDRFYEKAADPHLLALQPRIRELLLANIPTEARIGVYHGDFQWGNLLYSDSGELRAVIDWELTGIGATLNDVGWIVALNAPRAGADAGATPQGLMPGADALEAMYTEAWGAPLHGLAWFKALAVYKFAIISGFNLMLHRRGKRDDPYWEEIAPSMQTNMEYALELLTS